MKRSLGVWGIAAEDELLAHEVFFLGVVVGDVVEVVGEEKNTEDAEHDEELDDDQGP